MFRFQNPEAFNLFFLVLLLVFVLIYFSKRTQKKVEKTFGTRISTVLLANVSYKKRFWKRVLEVLALCFFILALARPQFGQSNEKIKSEGVELIIAADVSNSMLAEDVRPSRLEFMKSELSRFVALSSGDKMGIMAFAGSALLLSPMTSDSSAVQMYIESLSPDTVSTQGTAFEKVFESALAAFERGGVDPDQGSRVTRVLLIASDGEDNEDAGSKAAEELRKKGIRIFTVGFGTEKGAPIPVRDNWGNLQGYKKDSSGQIVNSATRGTVLKEIATIGGGSFYHSTFGGNAMKSIRAEIDKLEKQEFDSEMAVNYDEKFQALLLWGVLMALIELFLGERKPNSKFWKGRFEVAT